MKDARLRVRSLVTALVLLLITSFTVRAQEGDGFQAEAYSCSTGPLQGGDRRWRCPC